MTSRVLGAVGRFLITAGVVVLLFVAYQLWGTGLQEASAQGSLDSEFEELLESLDVAETQVVVASTTTTAAPATTTDKPVEATTTTAPSNTIPVFEPELAEALHRDGGEPIARITMRAIGVRKVVVEGVKVEDLRNGPGHYRATVLPGQRGNSGIAGHRTTYGAPFNRIDELEPGELIDVRTPQGFHQYEVMSAEEAFAPDTLPAGAEFEIPEGEGGLGHIIVRPEATWVLGDFGDDRLTLTACHPKLSAARRIIVAAKLVSEPADAIPAPTEQVATDDSTLANENVQTVEAAIGAPTSSGETDEPEPASTAPVDRSAFVNEVSLDEGLNGESGALLPAILWGLAAIAVYQGFKELGRRWRLWPSIALGIVPVVVLMALSFEKIDRFLPAG